MFNTQQSTIISNQIKTLESVANNNTTIAEHKPKQNSLINIDIDNKSLIFRKVSDKTLNKTLFNNLITICNNPDQSLVIEQLKAMLADYDYKSTKTWMLTELLADPICDGHKYYCSPIIYAYDNRKLIIAKTLLQIIEKKHLQKYGDNANRLGWIIPLCSSNNGCINKGISGHDLLILYIVNIYIKNNIDLKILEPIFKKNFSILACAIRNATENASTENLKTLLTIANTNNLFMKILRDWYDPNRLCNLDLLRSVFADTYDEKLEIIKIYKKFNFPLDRYIESFLSINNYEVFKIFFHAINNNYDLRIANNPIVNYAMKSNSYDIALTLISLGANINSECNNSIYCNSYCLRPLDWAIYYKNINMIKILLVLGAKRFYKSNFIEKCKLHNINTLHLWIKKQENLNAREQIRDILVNPPSLARIASVSIAKNLIIIGKDNLDYGLNDMKKIIAESFPIIAKDINSIEDLFSLNVLYKENIQRQLKYL